MSPDQLRARPIPGRWSTLEVVCHVVDSDGVLADRMKRIIAEDKPVLLNADETQWVARLRCHDRNIQQKNVRHWGCRTLDEDPPGREQTRPLLHPYR